MKSPLHALWERHGGAKFFDRWIEHENRKMKRKRTTQKRIMHTDPWVKLLLEEEAAKRTAQKKGWWSDWVPAFNRKKRNR